MSGESHASVEGIVNAVEQDSAGLPYDELVTSGQHAETAANLIAEVASDSEHGQAVLGAIAVAQENLAAAVDALDTGKQELTAYQRDITGSGQATTTEAGAAGHRAEHAFTDEKTLFTERIAVLEREAAEGKYTNGEPVDILVGLEVESQFMDDGTQIHTLDERALQMTLDLRKIARKVVRPEGQVTKPTPEELERMIEEGRMAAKEFVATFPAHTDEERIKRLDWFRAIDSFGPKELIHFELYQEFSTPMVGIPVVPPDAPYEEVVQYGKDRGWVEFRWGPEAGQVGWEDTVGISEMRLSPCPPTEAARRKNIVMQRFGNIAAKWGMGVIDLGLHPNVSVYQRNEAGENMPILGVGQDKREQTQDALAGMSAGITDGTWLDTNAAQQPELFDAIDHTFRFTTSHTRTSIRVHTDRLELRDVTLIGSVEQGIVWSMGGVLAGLQTGHRTLAAAGYEVPQVVQTHRVLREDTFDKKNHVDIQRAIEQSKGSEDGGFILDHSHNLQFAADTAKSFVGIDVSPNTAYVLNDLILRSMRVDEDGTPRVPLDVLQANFADMPDLFKEQIGWMEELLGTVSRLAESSASHVRVVPTEVISGGGAYRTVSPAEREQQLLNSPVARLTYGDGLPGFAAGIRRVGEHARATQTSDDVFERLQRSMNM